MKGVLRKQALGYLPYAQQHFDSKKVIHIRNRIKPTLGDKKITSIHPDHMKRFYSDLIKSGLSKSTVRYVHGVVSKTLGIALKWGLVGSNVAEAVNSPIPDPFEIKPLTLEQAKQFLEVLEDDRRCAFYVLLHPSCVRRGEALRLLKENLHLDAGSMISKHSLAFLPEKGLVLGEIKSEVSASRYN